MEKDQLTVIDNLKGLNEGHIIYFFEYIDAYIKNVIDFAISGLEQDQYSIIIENDRISPLILKGLKEIVSGSQLNKIKFINNYDFYFAKGDFQCASIFDYLPSLIKDYSKQQFSVRSWAHVEWGDVQEIHENLANSEQEADIIVKENRLLSVCAYDADRVSETTRNNLISRHGFLINDYPR
ncbi:hypothetical protein CEQ21_02180 [Niallia circulans]|uniref:MEDS domain-containing protein n=1 Tax=Niallia circulans TaxID=1397 RepID=A0A553SS22_NIACI|nr:MEDS domain-containing protein [Niallia circulans]TRZ39776.1 hypothetical protein CEQ21_02180 [Niallia circulans]